MLDQQLLEHARSVWREFAERCAERREQRRQVMDGCFKDFMEDLLNYPQVRPWRESLDLFQEHYWAQQGVGMRLTPESYDKVAALIERRLCDPRCGAYGPIRPDATGIPPKIPIGVAVARTAEKSSPSRDSTSQPTAGTKPATPAPRWPALSEEDRERNRDSVGIRWWWPIQPTGPFDDDWERRFEELARQSKDLLLAVYRELAATGKLAKALEAQEDAELRPLEERSAKAQAAFDAYQYSVVQLRRKWVTYQNETQSIGIHVFALVERIDAALPTRIEGLKSRYDRELADAARQSVKAGRAALSSAEGASREIRFVDWAVTAVDILTLLGAIRATAMKVAVKALAEGATESAARHLAVRYAVKQLVLQSAVAAGAQAVVPPILSGAGLDENEIHAGLAILQALQTLAALKTLKVGAAPTAELPEVIKAPVSARQFWKKSIIFKGIKVYQRDDLIDPLRKDRYGRTSFHRMRDGEPPIGPDGDPIELHHMLQADNHPLAEVSRVFHETNSRSVHINPKTIPSGIDRSNFKLFRREYWKNRALDFLGVEE